MRRSGVRSNCASKHSTIVLVESTAAVRCTGVVSTYMITPCSVSPEVGGVGKISRARAAVSDFIPGCGGAFPADALGCVELYFRCCGMP